MPFLFMLRSARTPKELSRSLGGRDIDGEALRRADAKGLLERFHLPPYGVARGRLLALTPPHRLDHVVAPLGMLHAGPAVYAFPFAGVKDVQGRFRVGDEVVVSRIGHLVRVSRVGDGTAEAGAAKDLREYAQEMCA
jgi:hypothetical protein